MLAMASVSQERDWLRAKPIKQQFFFVCVQGYMWVSIAEDAMLQSGLLSGT